MAQQNSYLIVFIASIGLFNAHYLTENKWFVFYLGCILGILVRGYYLGCTKFVYGLVSFCITSYIIYSYGYKIPFKEIMYSEFIILDFLIYLRLRKGTFLVKVLSGELLVASCYNMYDHFTDGNLIENSIYEWVALAITCVYIIIHSWKRA